MTVAETKALACLREIGPCTTEVFAAKFFRQSWVREPYKRRGLMAAAGGILSKMEARYNCVGFLYLSKEPGNGKRKYKIKEWFTMGSEST